jgi:hypothetical protein
LDSFARAFSANLKLGETFWKALVEMTFRSAVTKFHYVRTAIVATNLISPK